MQEGPGRFRGTFDANEIGSYLVTVAEPDPRGGLRTRTTGFSLPYPAEYRTVRPNRPLLARLSETTGGKTLTKPEEASRAVRDPGASITELWPFLLTAAAILIPIDVGIRRIAIPFGEVAARASARLRRRPAPVQAEVVGRLRGAKARADTKRDAPESAPKAERKTEPKPKSILPDRSATESLLDAKRRRKGGD